jgi:hypothetical protein
MELRTRSKCFALMLGLLVFLQSNAALAGTGTGATPGASGGQGAGGGQNASAASAASGGTPPTSVAGFACQSCTNFFQPADGWANWSKQIAPPVPKTKSDHYLCFSVKSSDTSPDAPIQMTLVPRLTDSEFPCYPFRPSNNKAPRPAPLHGDRLRAVIDFEDSRARKFFTHVSEIDLDVVLTNAPPLEPTLLRLNLGGPATTSGLGGPAAPEPGEFVDYGRCYRFLKKRQFDRSRGNQRVDLSGGNADCHIVKSHSHTKNPEHSDLRSAQQIVDLAEHDSDLSNFVNPDDAIIILPWGYTLPGDVIPTVYVSLAYPPLTKGSDWEPDTYYPTGSTVKCPGEDICLVERTLGAGIGRSGTQEPSWPGPVQVPDRGVTWTQLTGNLKRARQSYAPDGTPTYHPDDAVIWMNGQSQVQSVVQAWKASASFIKNQSVIVVPSDPKQGVQTLYFASDVTGDGKSGDTTPVWPASVLLQDNSQIVWTYDIAGGSVNPPKNGWIKNTDYHQGDRIRCAASSQQSNLCISVSTGFSGEMEPWWSKITNANNLATQGPSGAVQSTAASPSDNHVNWVPLTLANSTSNQAHDSVFNSIGYEWEQVHAPSLWGLSTGFVYTLSSIPSSYSFAVNQSGGCPASMSAAKKTTITPCPHVVTSTQRNADIGLMISPYVFHHMYAKWFDLDAPDGIDSESGWDGRMVENYIPEPVMGFSLNSIGSNYYVGLSDELFIRNLEFIGGKAWVKTPFLTNPVTGSGMSATPNTYSRFTHPWFVGVSYNISSLISGH